MLFVSLMVFELRDDHDTSAMRISSVSLARGSHDVDSDDQQFLLAGVRVLSAVAGFQ